MIPRLPDLLIEPVVRLGLAEDLGRAGDVTARACVPEDARLAAVFAARKPGVVAGLDAARLAFALLDPDCRFEAVAADGDAVQPGAVLARVEGPARAVLSAERTALNLLGRLSGIATLTAEYVRAVEGTGARIADTRKTTPGLRALEKYAVRCGGGVNHRMGLSDMALVKDNHVAAAGGVAAAYALVRGLEATIPVEIEVDTLDGLRQAIDAGADEVLLDNFDLETTRAAVAYRDEHAPRVRLEASGGLTVEVARRVAETGVDFIAVGELTHSARVLDLGLDLREESVG